MTGLSHWVLEAVANESVSDLAELIARADNNLGVCSPFPWKLEAEDYMDLALEMIDILNVRKLGEAVKEIVDGASG